MQCINIRVSSRSECTFWNICKSSHACTIHYCVSSLRMRGDQSSFCFFTDPQLQPKHVEIILLQTSKKAAFCNLRVEALLWPYPGRRYDSSSYRNARFCRYAVQYTGRPDPVSARGCVTPENTGLLHAAFNHCYPPIRAMTGLLPLLAICVQPASISIRMANFTNHLLQRLACCLVCCRRLLVWLAGVG